jgi:RimJ/RimL family protein N-acetyltransferase
MRLDAERIFLKKLSMDELDGNYVTWLNDPEVCRYNSHGEQAYTREMAKKFIGLLEGDDTREVWAVYLKETGLHIGNISLQRIDRKNRNAEIAYLFGEKQYWGKGYAKEASRVLLKHAFGDLKLHRVYFGTNIHNLAMQKLGEGLSFKKEGVLKDAQFKNGSFNDVVMFGLLAEEYAVL